jgi:UDP-N-acetylmuramoyl-tripeptide--D-alanyl-D-alanine ligase
VDRLFAFGAGAAHAARGAKEGGMSGNAIDHTTDRGRLREAVHGYVAEGDVVLVKGSRGMGLDEVAADIREVMA